MSKDYAAKMKPRDSTEPSQWIRRLSLSVAIAVLVVITVVGYHVIQSRLAESAKQHSQQPHKLVKKAIPVVHSVELPVPRFDFYTLLPNVQVELDSEPHTAPKMVTSAKPQRKKNGVSESQTSKQARSQRDYWIQIASFLRASDADRMRAHLAMLGFSTQVVVFRHGKTDYYRVVQGPFVALTRAQHQQTALTKAGYKNILLSKRG